MTPAKEGKIFFLGCVLGLLPLYIIQSRSGFKCLSLLLCGPVNIIRWRSQYSSLLMAFAKILVMHYVVELTSDICHFILIPNVRTVHLLLSRQS